MIVFRCAHCGTDLSVPVRQVPLPPEDEVPLPFQLPDGEDCPPRLAPGTFAYDPRPSRFAWGRAPKGTPAPRVTDGAMRSAVLSPEDVRGVEPVPRRRQGCCGPSGSQGPNLVCAGCGAEVAVETADCYTMQEIVLDPRFAEAVARPARPRVPGVSC
ncbi:hypothetical protein ACGFYQ_10275 [Streptomyces sp. NPDC048258]|uniref:hypothetical protein n=1 Tax=Streptomyces sp. NPDC048258 TaxID=3365527 RepID=UPI00371E3188